MLILRKRMKRIARWIEMMPRKEKSLTSMGHSVKSTMVSNTSAGVIWKRSNMLRCIILLNAALSTAI